jgi:hypothetical protein
MKTAIVIALLLISSLCLAAQYEAEVIGSWAVNKDGVKVSSISVSYPECGGSDAVGRADKSGELAEPNLGVWHVTCDNETLLKLKSDGGTILWMKPVGGESKPTVEAKQTKAELDTLKADLSDKGIIPADIAKTALSDTSKADVTAVDVSTQLKSVMKEFPATKVEEVRK